ncbi:MAG: hydroxyethylthiazole kinase [Bacteroidota bacterium]
MTDQSNLSKDLEKLREQAPLIHNITNYVVMNPTANALLSIGASPVMAHEPKEMEEMVSIASALVINIGTLSERWIEAMHIAGQAAKNKGKPIILDPVGAGATSLRTDTTKSLIEEVNPQIIRGNASEILAVAKAEMSTKGVDSTASADEAVNVAQELAKNTKSIVSISGKTDYITDGNTLHKVENGHPLMGKITGTGCTASALTAAFSSVNADYLVAATEAMQIMGIAGEMAGEEADAPGTFQAKFLDALYKMNSNEIKNRIK